MGNSTINILPVWKASTKKNKIFCYFKFPFHQTFLHYHVTKEQVDSIIIFDLTKMLAVYLFIWKYLSAIIKNALHWEIFLLADDFSATLWYNFIFLVRGLNVQPWAIKFIVNRRFLNKLDLYYDVKKIDSFNLAFLLKGTIYTTHITTDFNSKSRKCE